jgi:LPXTG-site transpeptidase (sortase) family protein
MSTLYQKIRDSWIKSILFSCFLLAIFMVLFYVANLDIFAEKNANYQERVNVFKNSDEEFKKRIGAVDVSSLSYDEWSTLYGVNSAENRYDDDLDKDGLPNFLEYAHMTDSRNADTDKDGFSDRQEIINGYDPDAPGEARPTVEISIARMNISAPMVWSKGADETSQLEDLKSGLSHFAKTASPGQQGNMIVSGHSSNYVWAEGNFNYIFKDLNNLEKGDMVRIKTMQKNGRVIIYHYKVMDKFIASPEDERIFANSNAPTLTLSTCWPLGTNFKRLIVKAELVK